MGQYGKRAWRIFRMTRDINGKEEDAVDDIVSKGARWTEGDEQEVVGDGNANGTEVCNLTIAAGKVFMCMSIMGSTNISAILILGTGTLGSTTDYYCIDLQNVGGVVIVTEETPIFIVDNSAGTSALTLRMYAPQTAMGVTTNNDANHYFNGSMGGVEI